MGLLRRENQETDGTGKASVPRAWGRPTVRPFWGGLVLVGELEAGGGAGQGGGRSRGKGRCQQPAAAGVVEGELLTPDSWFGSVLLTFLQGAVSI